MRRCGMETMPVVGDEAVEPIDSRQVSEPSEEAPGAAEVPADARQGFAPDR